MYKSMNNDMIGTRNDPTALYVAALGVHFSELPPVLQRLHRWGERRLHGNLQVHVAPRFLPRLLLWLARMPWRTASVPCRVWISSRLADEHWRRHIGAHPLTSYQTLGKDGEIIERIGPLALHLHSKVVRTGLWQRTVRTTCLGVTLPRWLGMHVVAHERPLNTNSYSCNIRLHTPLFGRLLQYRGVLVFEEE